MTRFKIQDYYTHIYAGRILSLRNTATGQTYTFGTHQTAVPDCPDTPAYALLSDNPSKAPDRFFQTCPSPIELWNQDLEITGLLGFQQ